MKLSEVKCKMNGYLILSFLDEKQRMVSVDGLICFITGADNVMNDKNELAEVGVKCIEQIEVCDLVVSVASMKMVYSRGKYLI